ARRSSLVARRSSLVARRSSLVARRSSLVARRSSLVRFIVLTLRSVAAQPVELKVGAREVAR
ncbi:hypothetical protein, partial [Paracoccus sp. (in: a-proteobacteria)]|uniref:hypothetical protein n=1 Tax=Paracoccus sp. TaxID=267 RepID=UPI0035B12B8B